MLLRSDFSHLTFCIPSLTYTSQLPHYCHQWACPIQTLNILGAKSHIHFSVHGSFCQRIWPSLRLFRTLHNNLGVLLWEVVSPHPTPKLEDHPLSAVRDCLFNIFAATLHIWRPSPASVTWGRTMPWWRTHLTWLDANKWIQRKLSVY
jgi:hypothetical protein